VPCYQVGPECPRSRPKRPSLGMSYGFCDDGVRYRGSWRCRLSWSGGAWLNVLLPCSSAVEEAASPPAVQLRPELPLQLHKAPDPGAVSTDVGLDVAGRLLDGCHVDAEQLRAPLQRRRDRPAQVRVLPSPHRDRLSN
jgi:hypothetical protein